ncbi:MAG: oligosaccharide flippase family protein [Campylobacterales bacterium]|nr:oligosaccharide flippase family protein [Campylobacterales bacterium]
MSPSISETRTKNYFKQIKGSFLFKGLAILASFLSIPLMIKYLGVEQYGVWSTLLSIVSWIVLFDLGIGNGLRNKISESLADDNKQSAQEYISTAYTIIGAISVVLILIFLLFRQFIPWQKIFNITVVSDSDLQSVVTVTIIFLLLNFWISLINQVFNGFQKTSLVVLNQFLSNLLSLLSVFILYEFYEPSLTKLAICYGISLSISSLMLSFYFYKRNREYIPKINSFKLSYTKSIVSLGMKFFIIQIAVIAIFTTDKILITQLFGPEYVTNYDVVFKLFSVITIVHGILMAPLWSAYSDAYHRNDIRWIKMTFKSQLKIYFIIILATIALIFLAKPIVKIWVGEEIFLDNILVYSIALFILFSTWNNIFAYFINATNKLYLALRINIFLAIANIPISLLYVKIFNFGVEGVVLGTVTSLVIGVVLAPWQSYNIIFNKGHTVWHR